MMSNNLQEESVIRKFDKNSEFNSLPTSVAVVGGGGVIMGGGDYHNPHNNQHMSSNDFSLLERYLNNEQIIANKHAQIERLLEDWFRECGGAGANPLIDDYSIIDYILNQEGISMRTFAQLIREKFDYIEWPREIIVELYRVVNGDAYESDNDNERATTTTTKTRDMITTNDSLDTSGK